MQPGSPHQKLRSGIIRFACRRHQLLQQAECGLRHARSLTPIYLIALHEAIDRRLAHVVMVVAPQLVVQHTQTQSAIGKLHVLQIQLIEYR